MTRFVLLFLTILCFACKEKRQSIATVSETTPKPAKATTQIDRSFEKITFSVMQGWSREIYDKDIEIRTDSTFNYRLRERYCCPIKANYTGKLDASYMAKVYAILDSIDFNTLKALNYEGHHDPYFSVLIIMDNGEVKFKGALDDRVHRSIRELTEIIESQEMKESGNHKFRTAKDVVIPPPNFQPTQALLDSL